VLSAHQTPLLLRYSPAMKRFMNLANVSVSNTYLIGCNTSPGNHDRH
jgi:hypothetical protein